MADTPFEIPQALRQVSEQNVKQARAAYEQLLEFMTKAMGPWTDAAPSNTMTAGLQHMQDRAMKIAMENAEAAFTFGGKMSSAQPPQRFWRFRRSLLKTGCKPSRRRRSNFAARSPK